MLNVETFLDDDSYQYFSLSLARLCSKFLQMFVCVRRRLLAWA